MHRGWSGAIVAAHRAAIPVVGGPVRNVGRPASRLGGVPRASTATSWSRCPPARLPGLTGHERLLRPARARGDRACCARAAGSAGCTRGLRERGFELHCLPEPPDRPCEGLRLRRVRLSALPLRPQLCRYTQHHEGFGTRQGASYAIGTPLLVPLTVWRIGRENVLPRPRFRGVFVRSLPLILAYAIVWAAGETVGYAFSGCGPTFKSDDRALPSASMRRAGSTVGGWAGSPGTRSVAGGPRPRSKLSSCSSTTTRPQRPTLPPRAAVPAPSL